jgi:hypothetical protein
MTLPIPEQIQDLNQQLEEAIQRVYMIRGAIQVLELNLPEEEETTTEEPTTEE